MILPKSIPFLPAGVDTNKKFLIDNELRVKHAINETGFLTLNLIKKKMTIVQISEIVSANLSIGKKEALIAITAFIKELNQNYLLNLKNSFLTYLSFLPFSFYLNDFSYLFSKKRFSVKGRGVLLFAKILAVTIWAMKFAGLFSLLLSLFLAFNLAFKPTALLPFTFFLALVLGFVFHEFSHLALSRYFAKNKETGFIAKAGLSLKVIRPEFKPQEEFIINLIGPLTPALIGIGFGILGGIFNSPLIMFIALVLAINLLSLCFGTDKPNLNLQKGGDLVMKLVVKASTIGLILASFLTLFSLSAITFFSLVANINRIAIGKIYLFEQTKTGGFFVTLRPSILLVVMLISTVYSLIHILTVLFLQHRSSQSIKAS